MMKIEVVAPNFEKASDYLRTQKEVVGQMIAHKVGVKKVWHGDDVSMRADFGEVWNVYSILVRPQPGIEENVQYVVYA